jgi:cell division septation protein DedD
MEPCKPPLDITTVIAAHGERSSKLQAQAIYILTHTLVDQLRISSTTAFPPSKPPTPSPTAPPSKARRTDESKKGPVRHTAKPSQHSRPKPDTMQG